jgi:hypothetical protein
MNPQPAATGTKISTEVKKKIVAFSDLDLIEREYLVYDAAGGVGIDESFQTKKMPIDDFALKLGVDRTTLWRRKQAIENWDDLKADIREQLWSDRRVTKVWNGIFARGAKGDYQQALLFLANWSKREVKIPNQKNELELGNNLAEFLNATKQRAEEHNLKVIDADVTDNA